MYEDVEKELKTILALVDKCPKEFREKCFEILLRGYVESQILRQTPTRAAHPTQPPPPPSAGLEAAIPAEALQRLKNTAKRLGVEPDALVALFDFSTDPFTFHAVSVPGDNNAEKSRNVALMAAARSYLATGNWVADWKEIKARCVDHGCYDSANHATNLKAGKSSLFKTLEVGKNVDLSSSGIQKAEVLLRKLASGE